MIKSIYEENLQNYIFYYFFVLVSYSQLIQFSLQKAHDSIRKALAKATTVSPLRLSDLHVSIIVSLIINCKRILEMKTVRLRHLFFFIQNSYLQHRVIKKA